MTIDNLILYLFGLIIWFTIVISFLVTVVWRTIVRDKKLIGFLLSMRFPHILPPNKRPKPLPLDKKSEKELHKALGDLGVDVKDGQSVQDAVLSFLNSDQVGPKREGD